MSATTPTINRPSLNETISWSMEWTKKLLFPFDFNRWLHFAFMAFLMLLGGGSMNFGTGFNSGNSGGGGRGGGPPIQDQLQEAGRFIDTYIGLIALGVLLFVLFILAVQALMKWLGARGQFMFLHGCVYNDTAIREPWSRYRAQANSLCRVYYLLFLVVFIPVLLVLGALFLMFYTIAGGGGDPSSLMTLLIVMGILFLLVIIPVALVTGFLRLCIDDLVVPVMFRDGCLFRPAAGRVWGLFRANKGDFLVYILLRLVVALVVGMLNGILVLLACCLTCGIALLPVLGQMPMLPGLAFRRYFPLAWLQQLGPDWAVFPTQPPA